MCSFTQLINVNTHIAKINNFTHSHILYNMHCWHAGFGTIGHTTVIQLVQLQHFSTRVWWRSGFLSALGPVTHEVDWRFPAAIHDRTYEFGSKLATETPLSFMNMRLDTVFTFVGLLLSHTVLFIAEKPLSHSAGCLDMFQQLQEVSQVQTEACLSESCTVETPLQQVLLLSPTFLLTVSPTAKHPKCIV